MSELATVDKIPGTESECLREIDEMLAEMRAINERIRLNHATTAKLRKESASVQAATRAALNEIVSRK